MADHLQHGPTDPESIDRADTQQNEAHVAHRTAGNSSFHVVLSKGVECSVDDVDDPNHDQGRR